MTAIDLYWLPLGAGGRCVAPSGRIVERIAALRAGRPPRALFHAGLEVTVPAGRHVVEMAPAWHDAVVERGVVATGPVGLRMAGRSRFFRYEVRVWRDGAIPDIAFAVGGPVRVPAPPGAAERALALLPRVPTPVWGRDELRAGEMWNSNSVVAWALTGAGIDAASLRPPHGGRAPGWAAGIAVARRGLPPPSGLGDPHRRRHG